LSEENRGTVRYDAGKGQVVGHSGKSIGQAMLRLEKQSSRDKKCIIRNLILIT
jgi:hypothetical protein